MKSQRKSLAPFSIFNSKLKVVSLILLFDFFCFASSPQKTRHQDHSKSQSLKAHQHGVAVLNLAFEGNRGVLELTAPNESILGFEHKARTASEKMKIQKTEKIFRNQAQDIFVFDGNLKCQMTAQNINLQSAEHSGHTETQASYEVLCQKSPQGSKFQLHWESFFPKLSQVQVQILLGDLQKTETLSPSHNSVDLK